MKNVFASLRRRTFGALLPILLRPQTREQLTRLGSAYGGWTLPTGRLRSDSVCYSFGAGEDLTFDLELARLCGCTVHLFDPTPRARTHFEQLREAAKLGALPLDAKFVAYRPELLSAVEKLIFHPVGIWNENTTLEFYGPEDPQHVSHSIVNLQRTRPGFKAEVRTLDSIMEHLGHSAVDLMKADVEGAEFEVLEYLVEHHIFPDIMAIEFDAVAHGGALELRSLIELSRDFRTHDYQLAHIESWNYLFLRGSEIGEVRPF